MDFASYKPLRSAGKIPAVFTLTTQEKIDADKAAVERENMSEDLEDEFLTHIHYNIDEMLHSGIVLYGDPATDYVNDVATKLLANEPKLKKKLEFYVIKSNITNALSTDQGLIFVTLGLLAQIENEAQLAYVLSHEIAHFTESHVENAYTEKTEISLESTYEDRIKNLNNYSKDNELEADKLGIELYHKAGYSKNELLSAFDVLMYSYLPFDEVELPKTYFNSDLAFVPENYFPEEINKIQVEEDYDDSKSSHPNIRKRKDQVIDELANYSSWGKNKFLLEETRFKEVRNIARFESVRIDILNSQFGDALYSIFLLEKDFPNNAFLDKCKGQAWYGLSLFKDGGEFSRTVQKTSSVEGESHAMHYALRKFTKLQLFSMSTRILVDLEKKYPEDEEYKILKKNLTLLLADYSKFKLSAFHDLTYLEALNEFEESKQALLADISSAEAEEGNDEELSKYDKIKKKRDSKVATSEDEEFETKSFHLYLLSDLTDDELFKRSLRMAQNRLDEKEAEQDRLDLMSRKERIKAEQEKIDFAEVVMIDPIYTAYNYSTIDLDKSQEVEKIIIDTYQKMGTEFNVNVFDATYSEKDQLDTYSYNQRAILLDYIRQRSEYEDMKMFPVDYSELADFKKAHSDSRLMLVFGDFVKTMVTKKMSLSTLIVNVETGEVDAYDYIYVKRKPRKVVLEYYIFDFFARMGFKRN
ncbi:MAG: M48 family metalloprotease [Crocinitomicaceae bacterium]|nr:M48 family metalloprotease [Crocinitomicaceae bacterium]